MGVINSTTPSQLIEKAIFMIERNAGGIKEGCTANRILSFLLRAGDKFGLAYQKEINKTLGIVFSQMIKLDITNSMTRPDLLDLMFNLIQVHKTDLSCQQSAIPVLIDMKRRLLYPDNMQFISLQDTNSFLVLLLKADQLDVTSKN